MGAQNVAEDASSAQHIIMRQKMRASYKINGLNIDTSPMLFSSASPKSTKSRSTVDLIDNVEYYRAICLKFRSGTVFCHRSLPWRRPPLPCEEEVSFPNQDSTVSTQWKRWPTVKGGHLKKYSFNTTTTKTVSTQKKATCKRRFHRSSEPQRSHPHPRN